MKLKLVKHKIKQEGDDDGGSRFKLAEVGGPRAAGTDMSYVGREHVRDQSPWQFRDTCRALNG